MRKHILIAFLFCSLTSKIAFSSTDQVKLDDVMIALTFKGLAKTFISVQKKEELVRKMDNMDNGKFRIKYARAYQAIKDYPAFCLSYGFREDMTKEELIKKIKRWSNKKMFEIIDSIPDAVISAEFKLYLNAKIGRSQKSGTLEQASWAWDEIIGRLGIK